MLRGLGRDGEIGTFPKFLTLEKLLNGSGMVPEFLLGLFRDFSETTKYWKRRTRILKLHR